MQCSVLSPGFLILANSVTQELEVPTLPPHCFLCPPTQDRVMINRLDSICQAVLKEKWPGTRRAYEPGGTVASFYTNKLLDSANSSLCEDPSASPQGSKVKKHVAESKEFSVKLNDVC